MATSEDQDHSGDGNIRDIHALTPSTLPPNNHPLGSYLSMATSETNPRGEFSNMSTTNSTLVLAGSMVGVENDSTSNGNNWDSVGEDNVSVGQFYPSLSPIRGSTAMVTANGRDVPVSLRSLKKEEVESKIAAWKNAKIAEINNRFKCEDAIINGWENEQTQKSSLQMKKVERKLEEKRARALEKMNNEIAKAHQKAEERRASAEAKRGTRLARVLEVANLMKAVGRSPAKNAFF